MKTIHLGFEVGTGKPVEIPLRHLAITGQTQEAGKTTTLEALIERSQLRAVTFVTKRGEGSFAKARRIQPYFREQTDWQYVASILEASRGEKLKFERAWIIRASKGARTLADVQTNVRTAMEKAKGLSLDVYTVLDAYLDVVVPQIASVKWAPELTLAPGVNVMDLGALALEMQHLVIRSAITWVLEKETDTVVVVPEAWKFIPQGRGTPAKLAAESYIRQGAGLSNYLWLDSQDIGGVEKSILRSVPVWLLGVQREANEIKRTLDNIPANRPTPKPDDIARLRLGEFYACWHDRTVKVYVQPAWMNKEEARVLSVRGRSASFERVGDTLQKFLGAGMAAQAATDKVIEKVKEEDPAMCEKHQELERQLETAARERARLQSRAIEAENALEVANQRARDFAEKANAAVDLQRALARLLPVGAGAAVALDGPAIEDAIVAKVLSRIPAGGGGPITVTPPEKLRKDFQREEADRIVAAAREFKPLAKRVLKLMEALEGEYLFQKTIADRLGRSMGGGARVDLGQAVKELEERGWIKIDPKRGVGSNLRAQIAADLSSYQPTAADVDAVYQAVLYEIATEAAAA